MKSIDTATREEFYRQNFFAVDLLEIQVSPTLYLSTGGLNIRYDSATAPDAGANNYEAQGNFLGFSNINESFETRVGKFSVQLTGIGTDYITLFRDSNIAGKRVVLYKAFLKYADLSIAGTPLMMFDGVIFNVNITEARKTCNIQIDCASLFSDFERTAGRQTNNRSNWLYQGNTDDYSLGSAGWVGTSEFKWGRL
jgi:hypothetical protein